MLETDLTLVWALGTNPKTSQDLLLEDALCKCEWCQCRCSWSQQATSACEPQNSDQATTYGYAGCNFRSHGSSKCALSHQFMCVLVPLVALSTVQLVWCDDDHNANQLEVCSHWLPSLTQYNANGDSHCRNCLVPTLTTACDRVISGVDTSAGCTRAGR